MASKRARPTSKRRARRGGATPLEAKAATAGTVPTEKLEAEVGPAPTALSGKPAAVLLPTGPVPLAIDTATLSMGREAMQWSYIVRNRKRWAGRVRLADEQIERARTLLAALGLSTNDLTAIARAQVAQVSIP